MTPVVLSVDPGIDDALALVLALRHPAVDVRAVVCSYGNVPLGRALANAAHLLRLLDRHDLALVAGSDRPTGSGSAWTTVRPGHAPDGLGGLAPSVRPALVPAPWPDPTGLGWVALGPLTDVPETGPAWVAVAGSPTGSGGFNLRVDPVAWQRLRHSDLPVRAIGREVASAPGVGPADVDRLAVAADPVASLVGRLLRVRRTRVGRADAPLGDAAVLAAALDLGDPVAALLEVLDG